MSQGLSWASRSTSNLTPTPTGTPSAPRTDAGVRTRGRWLVSMGVGGCLNFMFGVWCFSTPLTWPRRRVPSQRARRRGDVRVRGVRAWSDDWADGEAGAATGRQPPFTPAPRHGAPQQRVAARAHGNTAWVGARTAPLRRRAAARGGGRRRRRRGAHPNSSKPLGSSEPEQARGAWPAAARTRPRDEGLHQHPPERACPAVIPVTTSLKSGHNHFSKTPN